MNKIKVIAIVGPTASGKSEMAVNLAKKVHGQIISADSRQVYKGMDIGSGKVTPLKRSHPERAKRDEGSRHPGLHGVKRREIRDPHSSFRIAYTYKSIPHWGIDIASPKTQYSVAKFQSYGKKKILEIYKNKQTPIICGGTGQWVDSLINDLQIPEVKPNFKLRAKLEKKSTNELFAQLQKLDPERAKNIDSKNSRRLIRALEIILTTGKPVPKINQKSKYNCLWIGVVPLLKKDQSRPMSEGLEEVSKLINIAKLHKNIEIRLKERLKEGMVEEVKKLHESGVSWKHLEDFGLEYKYCALYLQNKLELDEMTKLLSTAIKQYAKRQLTWFKRNQNIHWVTTVSQAQQLAKNFIKHA